MELLGDAETLDDGDRESLAERESDGLPLVDALGELLGERDWETNVPIASRLISSHGPSDVGPTCNAACARDEPPLAFTKTRVL